MKLFPTILAATMLAGTAQAATITITPHSAVNFYGSPSTAAYQANALAALHSGATTGGPSRATDPTGYEAITNGRIEVGDATVSGVTQWRGELNPPAPFDGEYGNRLHFGLHVTSDTQFSLSSVSFNMTSDDGSFDYAGNLTGTTFGATRLGIDYGGNGQYDGCSGDDVCYDVSNPGNDGTLINELVYLGIGNAFWVPYEDYSLADLAQYMREVGSVFVNMTYTVGQQSESATVEVVPEPAALGLMGLGVVALGLRRRKRG